MPVKGAGGEATDSGTLDIVIPETAVAGELLILYRVTDQTGGFTTPTGWTSQFTGGLDLDTETYYKEVQSGDAGSTVTLDDVGGPQVAVMFHITNHDPFNIFDADNHQNRQNDTVIDADGVFIDDADPLLLVFYAIDDASATITPHVHLQEHVQIATSVGSGDVRVSACSESPNVVGSFTADHDGTASKAVNNTGETIALTGAGGAVTVPCGAHII